MTFVIGRGGRLIYRADWTSAANVESFLHRYEAQRRRRPAGGGGRSPYLTEQLEYRDQDREKFDERLRRNGPRSYDEFRRAEEIWRERD